MKLQHAVDRAMQTSDIQNIEYLALASRLKSLALTLALNLLALALLTSLKFASSTVNHATMATEGRRSTGCHGNQWKTGCHFMPSSEIALFHSITIL